MASWRLINASSFAAKLIAWQKQHGRHDLPWQGTRDPYAIWVSEIMLQQTQVATVIPYYLRFLARFPDVAALAAAPLDEVLRLWSGLGYYSRARNLHRAAQAIVGEHGGKFPRRFEARGGAAGRGAFHRRGHLRVRLRRSATRSWTATSSACWRACGGSRAMPGEKKVADRLWQEAERLLPRRSLEAYTQGLMDLGAMVCTRTKPRCTACPVHGACVAFKRGWVGELPAPRPRKQLPHKRTVMLVLVRAGEILLEKRPPSGIWGGLWCLPEVARRRPISRRPASSASARTSSKSSRCRRSRTALRISNWTSSRCACGCRR